MGSTARAIAYVKLACRQFDWTDLRWAHLWILSIILVGALVNLLLPHGWTIWPLVPVMAALIVINEAAERNDQGVPPFQVYALVLVVAVVWIIGVLILSQVNLFIQLLGVGVLAYYSIEGYLKARRREQLIALRRQEGRCIHCGEECDPYDTLCGNCGCDPDPGRNEQQRLSAIVRHGRNDGHARAVLKQESYAMSAARKEQELLARAQQRRGRVKKR